MDTVYYEQKNVIIAVYDTTFVKKGSIRVEKFEDSTVYYSVCEGKAEVGEKEYFFSGNRLS